MAKPMFEKRVETWNVKNPRTDAKVTTDTVSIVKIAVRVRRGLPGAGQFHGTTNFRQRG